ncbi:hypothetical protein C8Q77DRAFT_1067114 [Trametes polyzona]|nr:hypothetical protein C8Q77DRAFT_1067114 [Trametes polyzona]
MATHMSLDRFLLTFFPRPSTVAGREEGPILSHKDVLRLTKATTAEELADNLVKLVNSEPTLTPGLKLALARTAWDPNADPEAPAKVDGALYPAADTPLDGRPHWEKQRLLVEITLGGPAADPFDDFDWSGAARARAERFLAHALAHQQRTALFTLLVNGSCVRLARWDRSGAIFTEPADFVERPAYLRDILWAFARLSPEAQGLDPTAAPLARASEEWQLMDEFARPQETDVPEEEGAEVHIDSKAKKTPRVFAYVRHMFAESLKGDGPRYKLLVPTKNGKEMRTFLVGAPTYTTPGATGRITRGYAALDPERRCFSFLKDTWTPIGNDGPGMLEGHALKKLAQGDVKNLPKVVCHGLLGQETQAPYYWGDRPSYARSYFSYTEGMSTGKKSQASTPRTPRTVATSYSESEGTTSTGTRKKPLRQFRHYRIVFEEICMPLHSFKYGRQLLSAVRDCVEAHFRAYKSRSRILHRDIGPGNILILPTLAKVKSGIYVVKWKGVLSDWELAKCMPYIEEPPAPRSRMVRIACRCSGTWHGFAAVHALDNPKMPAQVEDELESFMHVLHYASLRYLRSSCADVSQTIVEFFGEAVINPDVPDDNGQYPYPAPFCPPLKREATRTGILHNSRADHWPTEFPSCSSLLDEDAIHVVKRPRPLGGHGYAEFFLIDVNGQPNNHPLNKVFWTATPWVAARYAAIEAGLSVVFRPSIARMFRSHEPLLALFDSALAMKWPEDDRIGDRLEPKLSVGAEDSAGVAEVEPSVEELTAQSGIVEERRELPVAHELEREDSAEERPHKKAKTDSPGTTKSKSSGLPFFIRGLGLSRRNRNRQP